MRTKEEILRGIDDSVDRRKLEVEIDIRDQLKSIRYELEQLNKD